MTPPPEVVRAVGVIAAFARSIGVPASGVAIDVDRVTIGMIDYGDWRLVASRTRAPDERVDPVRRRAARVLPAIGRVVEDAISEPDILSGPVVHEGEIAAPDGPRRWRLTIEDLDAMETAAHVAAGGVRQ